MSLSEVQDGLMASLEQAFDVKKVFTVFDKLIGIIKDQQEKIAINDMKIADLYAQVKSGGGGGGKYEERIKDLEKKVADVMVNLHGESAADPNIINDFDSYKAFANAGAFGVDPFSHPATASSANKKERAKSMPSEFVPKAKEAAAVATSVPFAAAIKPVTPAKPPSAGLRQATPGVPQEPAVDHFPDAPVDSVEGEAAPARSTTPFPVTTDESGQGFAPPLQEGKGEGEGEGENEEDHDEQEAADEVPTGDEPVVNADGTTSPPRAVTPGTARATTPARARTPASPLAPKRMASAKIDPAKVAQEERVVTPETNKPKVYLKTASFANKEDNYVQPNFDPPEYQPPVPESVAVSVASTRPATTVLPTRRRKMSLSNLKLLTPQRHALILKLLKRKGMFLHIARTFQQDARKKYVEASLKQRVDVLESDVKRILNKMDNIKLALRKNNMAMRELLPVGFNESYASIIEFMNLLNGCGGTAALIHKLNEGPAIHNSINEINEKLKTVMCFDAKTGEPPRQLLEVIMSQMRSTILQDYEMGTSGELNKMKARLLEFGAHLFTKDDVLNMLSQQATNGTNSEYHENSSNNLGSNNDPMHMKLIKLIQSMIDKNNGKIDLLNESKKFNVIDLSANRDDVSAEKLEEVAAASKKYTDDRVHILKNAIKAVAIESDSKSDRYGQDLTEIQRQLASISSQFNESLQTQQEHIESFNKESAALKILQRKVNNMGMDKLMDDLKRVHSELLERPSASQVGEMMDLVETTIRSHLGENIVGLKGLVEQVYKHIQHKVDRDDIKGLITVKLAQMEADLLRREEEVYSMTSTTRCLSCGQMPINPLRKEVAANILKTGGGGGGGGSSVGGHVSTGHSVYSDDASAQSGLVAHMLSQSAPQLTVIPHNHRTVSAEQIVPLVTGNVGLKSLLPQHQPQQAVNPYQATSKRKTGEHIPEPLYRKAKMAAQMKEMVKVSTPASSVYGYGPNNPLYVLEGMVDDEGSVGSYASQNRAVGSKRVGTTGGGLHFNNMTGSNIQLQQQQQQQQRARNGGEQVTLPQIVHGGNGSAGAPTGFLRSPSEHALAAEYGGPSGVSGQSAKLNSYY